LQTNLVRMVRFAQNGLVLALRVRNSPERTKPTYGVRGVRLPGIHPLRAFSKPLYSLFEKGRNERLRLEYKEIFRISRVSGQSAEMM
jgi:hypothetical protein